MLLQTLYEQTLRRGIKVYAEYYVVSLLLNEEACCGVVAWDIVHGGLVPFHAKAVVLATGGYGRAYRITSNAHSNTGDGLSLIYRAGLPLEDMEFVQFHPTGLYKQGILLSEAARGEGAHLLNGANERFMARYAGDKMELAPRDVVSRAIQTEIEEGRGVEGKDYVYLDLRHLGRKKILERLPQVHELALKYFGIDCAEAPVPIQPTAHYSMGGIPVNLQCEVLADETGKVIRGLYAAGECACVSVHGANRLGTNSLLEAVLFGLRAGRSVAAFVKEHDFVAPSPAAIADAENEIERIRSSQGPERTGRLRLELQEAMMAHCGIFRRREGLTACWEKVRELRERFRRIEIGDKRNTFNTDLLQALELSHMLEFSEVIVAGALAREESRGAHARSDFPQRNDTAWQKHTLAFQSKDGPRLAYKPVTVTRFAAEERKY